MKTGEEEATEEAVDEGFEEELRILPDGLELGSVKRR